MKRKRTLADLVPPGAKFKRDLGLLALWFALFVLLEGLDPLCLVAADGKTAALLGQAYRCSVPTGDACRLFGRTAVSFIDFESLLQTPQDKQIAWALLKKLPKLNS